MCSTLISISISIAVFLFFYFCFCLSSCLYYYWYCCLRFSFYYDTCNSFLFFSIFIFIADRTFNLFLSSFFLFINFHLLFIIFYFFLPFHFLTCDLIYCTIGAFANPPILYGWIYPNLLMVLMIISTYCCVRQLSLLWIFSLSTLLFNLVYLYAMSCLWLFYSAVHIFFVPLCWFIVYCFLLSPRFRQQNYWFYSCVFFLDSS